MKGEVNWKPLIIIGAPRSGTNILRDLICELPGFVTWPCDEINAVWRHGNIRWKSDALPAECATKEVRRFIRQRFSRIARKTNCSYVVEKTCANSLRVNFVDRVFPEAKYVYIVRDGIDATASAMKRWKSPTDFNYLMRKARFVPVADLPVYFGRYAMNCVHRRLSSEQRLATWGPKFEQMESLLNHRSLMEVCAFQWRACVESADRAFKQISASRVLHLRYEDFVGDPMASLIGVCRFLGSSEEIASSVDTSMVSPCSVGLGRRELATQGLEDLDEILRDLLERHGYASL